MHRPIIQNSLGVAAVVYEMSAGHALDIAFQHALDVDDPKRLINIVRKALKSDGHLFYVGDTDDPDGPKMWISFTPAHIISVGAAKMPPV